MQWLRVSLWINVIVSIAYCRNKSLLQPLTAFYIFGSNSCELSGHFRNVFTNVKLLLKMKFLLRAIVCPITMLLLHVGGQQRTCSEGRAAKNMQRRTCSKKRAAKNVQRRTYSKEHAAKDVQQRTCREGRAAKNMQRRKRTAKDMQRRTCSEERAEKDMQRRYAIRPRKQLRRHIGTQ